MRISVIVPVYNAKNYLSQCLDSIIGQCRKADEIILVDDGSTDGSAEICNEYAQKDATIQVVHQMNKGVSEARNIGIKLSSGDYIAFVDADDVIAPDYIAVYCSCIEKTGCDTCKGTYHKMRQTGESLLVCRIESGTYHKEGITNELIPRIIGSAPDKKDSVPVGVWGTFYDSEIIREHHLVFPSEQQLYSEDTAFNLLYMPHAKHVEIINYSGYYYRITADSLTNQYVADRFERCMRMCQWERDLLDKLDIYELSRYRLTRQLFNQMRNVFHQYKLSVCGLPYKEIRKELVCICGDRRLQEMIAQYPIHKLQIPQQIFVYLIKYKVVWLIYVLYNL